MSTTEAPTTLVRMMGEREKRLSTLEARLATLRTAPSVLDLEVRRMEREARKRLEDFTALMQRNPQEARAVLEALVTVPLRFGPVETPDGAEAQARNDVRTGGQNSGGVPSASPAGHALYCTSKSRGESASRTPALPAPFAATS